MSDSTGRAASVPAGWYSDPAGSGQLRWWDGAAWTEHMHPGRDVPTAVSGTAESQNPGRYNWYIWAIVLLPVVSIIAFGFIDLRGYMMRAMAFSNGDASPMAGMALVADPGYLVSLILGWIVYAATVVLAFLDWRVLERAAVVRPFHWAWSFLGGWVYVIGRCVVVKSRTGRGLLPIWVMIAVVVLGIIVAVAKMVDAISAVIAVVPTAP